MSQSDPAESVRLYGGAGVSAEGRVVELTVHPARGDSTAVNLHPDDADALARLLRDAAREARNAR
jgi:hypothetical protein